jgi:hypothetical protein
MELKAVAGDRDLYDVLKKQRRKQKTVNAAAAKEYAVKKARSSAPVFDFINVKLGHKKSGEARQHLDLIASQQPLLVQLSLPMSFHLPLKQIN